MQQQPRYQLRQPNDSMNARPFFIDLATARKDSQSEQRQYGRTGGLEQLPPVFTDVRRIERPSPQGFPRYSNSTDADESNNKKEQRSAVADRSNSLQWTTTVETKKSRCCHRRRHHTPNTSGNSCNYCFCCCIYNPGDQQTDTNDSCCDCQDCCECDDCCQCDCDCDGCGDCGGCDCGGCGDCSGCGDVLAACLGCIAVVLCGACSS